MTKLLLRWGILSAPFLVWLSLCEIAATHVGIHPLRARVTGLLKRREEIEAVVLGSSHAFDGVRADQLGVPAFNLAFPSQSHRYDAELLGSVLPALPKLRLVILSTSYVSLEYELEHGIESWRTYHYRYYLGLPQADRQWAMRARNFSFYFLNADGLRGSGLSGGFRHGFATDADEYGNHDPSKATDSSATIILSDEELRQSALQRLGYHHRQMDAHHLDMNRRTLDHLIGRLRQRSIHVALVMMPVTRAYRDGMRPASYQRMLAVLADLATRPDVTFRNYTADPRMSDADFADADHLNPGGAVKLTAILRDEVVSPELGHTPR
jgi:hypothetical protein